MLDDGYDTAEDTAEEAGRGVAGGAAGGAAVGAGAALLTSAGVLGGAAGAVVGATDSDDGVADETASYYRDRIDTSYAMVSVNVADSQQDEVVGILNAAGAHRVDSAMEMGTGTEPSGPCLNPTKCRGAPRGLRDVW